MSENFIPEFQVVPTSSIMYGVTRDDGAQFLYHEITTDSTKMGTFWPMDSLPKIIADMQRIYDERTPTDDELFDSGVIENSLGPPGMLLRNAQPSIQHEKVDEIYDPEGFRVDDSENQGWPPMGT